MKNNVDLHKKVLMITPALCTACRACQVACKQWNDLPADETSNTGSYENPPDLTGNLYNRVRFIEIDGDTPKWLFMNQRCVHCQDAPCIQGCNEKGAIFKSPEGFILYDKDKCLGKPGIKGKMGCAKACPYDVVRFDNNGKFSKCTFCYDRVSGGIDPACAKTCPTGAIAYGNKDELVAKAKTNGYTKIYGQKELSGLKVLYSLKESLDVYGLPKNPVAPKISSSKGDIDNVFDLFSSSSIEKLFSFIGKSG